MDRREFLAPMAAMPALNLQEPRPTPKYHVVTKRYRFFPKQMKFGTETIDRFLLDVIDNKRKQEGAISVWERDLKYYSTKLDDWQANPSVNRFIREPGHIEYASGLGLGIYETSKIQHTEVTV